MSSLLNVKLVVASLEGDVFKKRFLGGFLGLARILWGLEGVCVLLEDDRVNLTVCSVFSAVSQFSIKRNHINDQVFNNSTVNDLPLRGDLVGLSRSSSKSIFRRTLIFRQGKLIWFSTTRAMSIVLWNTNKIEYINSCDLNSKSKWQTIVSNCLSARSG